MQSCCCASFFYYSSFHIPHMSWFIAALWLILAILPYHTGVAVTPLARFLMLMSGRPLVCRGILLGFLLTLCFINLINDIYWGTLHSNQHLCREGPSAVRDGTLWASSAHTWLALSVSCCTQKHSYIHKYQSSKQREDMKWTQDQCLKLFISEAVCFIKKQYSFKLKK